MKESDVFPGPSSAAGAPNGAPAPCTPDLSVAEDGGWLWYYSNDPDERYYGGSKTRDEAIAEARNEYALGEAFTIIEACQGRPFGPPDADALMCEWLERWADDDVGADDYPDWQAGTLAVKAAERDLDEVIAAWAGRHQAIFPTPWAFAGVRNEEHFPARTSATQ